MEKLPSTDRSKEIEQKLMELEGLQTSLSIYEQAHIDANDRFDTVFSKRVKGEKPTRKTKEQITASFSDAYKARELVQAIREEIIRLKEELKKL